MQVLSIINAWLAYQVQYNQLPSITVGIVKNGRTIFLNGYGFADLEKRLKATPKTCYRMGSISKVFTSIAIMQLVEQKKVKLDEPIKKYLSWLPQNNKRLGKITVRHLLLHTSGLAHDGVVQSWSDRWSPDFSSLQKELSYSEIAVFEPGNHFKYSNTGYALLGQVIESVSGSTYEKYLQDNIFKPLNMSRSEASLTQHSLKNLASGYGIYLPRHKRRKHEQYDYKTMNAAGGVICDMQDFCKFMLSQFHANSSLLKTMIKKEMQKKQWSVTEDLSRGFGYGLWPQSGYQIAGHTGGVEGYTTHFALEQKNKLGVAIFTNAMELSRSIPYKYVEEIFNLFFYTQKDIERLRLGEAIQGSKMQGIYTGEWGDLGVVEFKHGLAVFDLASSSIYNQLFLCKRTSKDMYLVNSTDPHSNIGEKVALTRRGTGYELAIGPDTYRKE